jgi:2'-5' RNA ligase
MFYGLVYYPQDIGVDLELFRRRYDPTFAVIDPHITIMFPVPGSVGREDLYEHVEKVTNAFQPFRISMGGFQRSPDHWLFLTLNQGNREMKELYNVVYTGILEDYRRDDIEFIPHLSLGLFIRNGAVFDWNNPKESDFDEESYMAAMIEAGEMIFEPEHLVDRLHLVSIPDQVIEWATGKRSSIPDDARAECLEIFPLGI